MFKFIEGLPPDVLAVEAQGQITHADYRDTLIPKAEAMMAGGRIKMLYVIGKEFSGFDLEALWDDGRFGMKHWQDFSQVAVVTDHTWLRSMVAAFAPFMAAEVRLFWTSELPAAKTWIARI